MHCSVVQKSKEMYTGQQLLRMHSGRAARPAQDGYMRFHMACSQNLLRLCLLAGVGAHFAASDTFDSPFFRVSRSLCSCSANRTATVRCSSCNTGSAWYIFQTHLIYGKQIGWLQVSSESTR